MNTFTKSIASVTLLAIVAAPVSAAAYYPVLTAAFIKQLMLASTVV